MSSFFFYFGCISTRCLARNGIASPCCTHISISSCRSIISVIVFLCGFVIINYSQTDRQNKLTSNFNKNLCIEIWQFLFSRVMIVFSLDPSLVMNIFEWNVFCLYLSIPRCSGCRLHLETIGINSMFEAYLQADFVHLSNGFINGTK